MLALNLTRQWLTPNSTSGEIDIEGVFQCYTLELPLTVDGQQNVPDKTCIPPGTYPIEILWSPKHQCMKPWLVGVPGREAIQIDVANEPSQLLGCIAVGQGRLPDAVEGSQLAYNALFPLIEAAMAQGGCEIVIQDSLAQDLDAVAAEQKLQGGSEPEAT